MVCKVIKWLIIPFFAVFLMSQNVSAISPVINLNNYTLVRGVGSFNQTCTWSNGDNYTNGGNCSARINGRTRLTSIASDNQYAFKSNDLLVVYLFVWADGSSTIPLDYQPRLNSFGEIASGFDVLGYNVVDYNTYYLRQGGDDGYINWSPNNDFNINFSNYGYFYRIYELTLRARSDGNFNIGLIANSGLFEFNTDDSGSTINFSLRNAKQYRFEGDEANKEQQEKTQDAVDQSTSDGNSSQTTVESSTQSLMSAGGSIISALVNAQATDCNINVQTTGSSRLFTTAIGQLNLCSDVPQGVLTMVQGIVALVFTPIVLYFTYNVLTTLYNQFKEYNS